MPSDMYYRRGHWVRRPKSKSGRISGWMVLAVIAGVIWFVSHGAGDQQEVPQQPPMSEIVTR
ncbi:hypothetical protein SAMN05421833_12998 [Microbispora rosea]|uniref:Uncharacterized protein n=1 Tax=Microbispora rosea TaxID=58117 RepID=A0A1N7GJ86_9ACTN|nr:hypothetical protein Mro03_68690 [Microbispora rosea subsp. rosea]SIS12654.1 hypothetical protein SAMN05421833_12998 [Microbispora rosea]